MDKEKIKTRGGTRKDRDKKGEKSRYGKEHEYRIWKLKQQENLGRPNQKDNS